MKHKDFHFLNFSKRVLGVLTGLAVAIGSFSYASIPAYAATTGNLLKNSGAETGSLKYWKDSSAEKCWMVGYKGTIKGWDHPAPRSGKYYFMPGWPSESKSARKLYQDVKVSKYIGSTVTFTAYLGGYGHDDKGGIRLDILNNKGKVLATAKSKMYSTSFGDWSKNLKVSLKIPSGAYKARAYMVGSLYQGSECDAYFDDLKLTISTSKPSAGVVSKIENLKGGNVRITVKKDPYATNYQIRYKIGSKKNWTLGKSLTNNVGLLAVTKGAKITVQARVKNSAGWGKWGSSKSFTTDKK
jgi:hypothetical protein